MTGPVAAEVTSSTEISGPKVVPARGRPQKAGAQRQIVQVGLRATVRIATSTGFAFQRGQGRLRVGVQHTAAVRMAM